MRILKFTRARNSLTSSVEPPNFGFAVRVSSSGMNESGFFFSIYSSSERCLKQREVTVPRFSCYDYSTKDGLGVRRYFPLVK